MIYNYNFEVAASIFMLFILLHFLLHRQFPLIRTKIFLIYLVISMTDSLLNIASSLGCEYPDAIPLWFNQMLAMTVFLMEIFGNYCFFLYALQLCDRDRKWRVRMETIGAVPFVILAGMIISTPFTHWIFYFDADKRYVSGGFDSLCYLVVIGYVLAELILVLRYRHKMTITNKVIVCVYSISMMTSFTVQLFRRDLLVGGMAQAVVSLFIYVSMQNPGGLVDVVSGRYNEMAFRIMVNDKIERKQEFAILSLHLNKFNSISSVIGYKNVDNIIEQVGGFLAQVAGGENTYRTESHVFSVILPAEEETIEQAAKAIQERFTQKWQADNLDLMLNANIVIASSPECFETVSEMNSLRDYMMECAKMKGTNSTVVADAALKADYKRLNSVERAINIALEKESMEVYYQPIYSLRDGKMVAAEALARMKDDELGNIPPAEFIPIAEKNGSIVELGRQIFEKCCKFVAEELAPHPELGIHSIHINLSVVQCMQPDMAEQFIAIIQKYQVPPGMLNLELTERITLSTTELMRRHMQKLGAYGVKFSLDDYGTGSSNCAYLIDFAFPIVKFDKKMIDSYFEDETAHKILDSQFKILQELNIDIVAEGIETKEQVEKMRDAELNYIQGYYFAKPAPAGQFLELVRAQNDKKKVQVG